VPPLTGRIPSGWMVALHGLAHRTGQRMDTMDKRELDQAVRAYREAYSAVSGRQASLKASRTITKKGTTLYSVRRVK